MPDQASGDLSSLIVSCAFSGHDDSGRYGMRLQQRHDSLWLLLHGSLLGQIPEDFIAKVTTAVERLKSAKVVIDLSQCHHVSSMALAFMVKFHKVATAHGAGRIPLLRPTPRVLTLIKLLGLTQLFAVLENDGEAQSFLTAAGVAH